KLEDQVKALKQNLFNMDIRIGEQKQVLENEINDLTLKKFPIKQINDLVGNGLKLKEDYSSQSQKADELEIDPQIEKRKLIKDRFLREQEAKRNKDKGDDFGLSL
ncbi:MAG TPA: hypothetical protein VK590_16070, partial [Saprospiraceae bacterium]|nr:hypothetical protein [Saprospiraceae bacterium]